MKTVDERKAEFMAELSALCLKFGGATIEACDDGVEYFTKPAIEVFMPTLYDGKDNVTAEVCSFRFDSCDAHWKAQEESA